MSKKFFEVFPTLKLNGGMQDLFEQVMVERVSATKRKDFLRIYISSDRLIQKADVFLVEQEMRKQFFPGAQMVIRIYEKFRLSSQYTPEKLMDIYRESILLELRDYSPIEYNLFKNADITYPADGKVMLTLEDTVLGKEKAEELVRILDKIYNERCGFSVEILTDYKEHKAARHKEEDEKRLAMQIAEISAERPAEAQRRQQERMAWKRVVRPYPLVRLAKIWPAAEQKLCRRRKAQPLEPMAHLPKRQRERRTGCQKAVRKRRR